MNSVSGCFYSSCRGCQRIERTLSVRLPSTKSYRHQDDGSHGCRVHLDVVHPSPSERGLFLWRDMVCGGVGESCGAVGWLSIDANTDDGGKCIPQNWLLRSPLCCASIKWTRAQFFLWICTSCASASAFRTFKWDADASTFSSSTKSTPWAKLGPNPFKFIILHNPAGPRRRKGMLTKQKIAKKIPRVQLRVSAQRTRVAECRWDSHPRSCQHRKKYWWLQAAVAANRQVREHYLSFWAGSNLHTYLRCLAQQACVKKQASAAAPHFVHRSASWTAPLSNQW